MADKPPKSAPRKLPFTKTRLLGIPPPKDGRVYYNDASAAGLSLCVTNTGSRTFYFTKKQDGTTKRIRLGSFPDGLSVEQARKLAAGLNVEAAAGHDLQEAKRERRQEATFRDLFERWLEIHAKPKLRTWKEADRLHKTLLKSLDGRKLSAIRQRDIQGIHSKVGKDNGHYAANRCLELIRGVFYKAETLIGWKGENPARGVQKFKEEQRDRFLQADEIPRLFQSLHQEPDLFRDFFMLCLLTGARRGNVLSMAWADISLDRGLWRIPETKSGKPVIVPLVGPALEILQERLSLCNGSPWVFPSKSESGHLETVKSAWARILNRAGLSDLRPHDLRRSLGSWMTIGGSSLPIVGRALGHLGTSATEVYARLTVDPVRAAVDSATAAMLAAGHVQNGKETAHHGEEAKE